MLSYSQIPEGSEKDTEIWTAFWVESRLKQAFVSTDRQQVTAQSEAKHLPVNC